MSKATPELEFRRGYYLATANLMKMHGQSTMAQDLLRNYGAVNFRGIDAIDVDVLRPIAAEIRRKARR